MLLKLENLVPDTERAHMKPQWTLEFELKIPMENFANGNSIKIEANFLNPDDSSNDEKKWLIRLTSFEVHIFF